jgi:hypothetical protein
VLDVRRVAGVAEDVLDGEALELGHVDDLHVVAADDLLDPHGEVSEVPHGDRFVAGKVGLNF